MPHAIRRPDTSGVQDTISHSKILTRDQVIEMFTDIFDKGLDLLEGEYHIRLNESA